MTLETLLRENPVLPVVTLNDAADAVPLAEALVRGGIRAIEVTLRTPAALDAISRIRTSVPAIRVGAGTVCSGEDLASAIGAGAEFAISPGTTPELLRKAVASGTAFLPGIASASEILLGMEHGIRCFKFFPAEVAGGIAALRAFAGPFPDARFCPTGGLTLESAPTYLRLPNVLCVGGSWLAPEDRIALRDWSFVERQAFSAAKLPR